MTDTDVLVVGGGVSGLAIAWWLARAGLSVEVWERDARAGGKIGTDAAGGYLTERAASLLVNDRPAVDALVRAAGLDARVARRATVGNRYVVHQGRLAAVPTKLVPLLASPLWSLRGKLRLFAEPLVRKGGHERESVSEFVTRRLGRELLDKAMEPFVAGTLASDPDRANAYAVLPQLTGLERRYGGIAAGVLAHRLFRRRSHRAAEPFSFGGGFATLVETLAAAPGIRLRVGLAAAEIAPARSGWRVTGRSAHAEPVVRARHVVLSTPAGAGAALVRPLDRALAELLEGIEYTPLSVVHLGFDRERIAHPLDGTGFLLPRGACLAPTGCLWMSALFPDRAPAGRALLTCYLGGARRPEAAAWDDARSADEVLAGVGPLLGIRGEPEMVRIDRHAQALPLYHGAYHGRMQAVAQRLTALPGLHVEANFRGGVSVRNRLARASEVARTIAADLRRPVPAARPLALAAETAA
jgi:oxygen-dependent protoporphyrinogen oxidase